MSAVIKPESGARVLPTPEGTPRFCTGWAAHLACDADLRTRYAYWRTYAENLQVIP